jgi:hypothetical protein
LCVRSAVLLAPGITILLSAGCAADSSPAARAFGPRGFTDADRIAASRDKESSARPIFLASAGDDLSQVPAAQRIVIYNAGFRIVVQDIGAAIKATEHIAEKYAGYVQKIDGDRITIRVPVARYQEATAAVEALGQVTTRQLEASDVTEEYVDLEARLKNARAVRQRLETLLARAEDVKAAVEVERELKRIGEEVEQLEAKLELIKNRIAYSTITAAFERVAPQTTLKETVRLPFAWLRLLDPNRLWQSR